VAYKRFYTNKNSQNCLCFYPIAPKNGEEDTMEKVLFGENSLKGITRFLEYG
jgi:hypothetical protein